MGVLDVFNRSKARKVELHDGTEKSKSGKLAIKNEGIITVIKIVCALICVFTGTFLACRGNITSEYSIIIQVKESVSIKCTDTPPGVVLLIFSILLLWKTKQDIKIGK
jgi:hypothetical protein